MSETLSGGTVSLPVRPNTAGFGKLLGDGLLAESSGLVGIGKALGAKLLVGFGAVEIGLEVARQIGDSVNTAKTAEAATAQLKNAVKNAGFEYDDYAKKIEKAQAAGRKFGFTNQQTTDALSQLTIGLKDPAKALQVLGVAQDLAVAKHMDLNSAALLVTKGMEGQVRPLKALGIDIPVYAGNAQAVALAQNKVAAAQQKVNDILAKTPDAVNASSSAHGAYEKAVGSLATAQQQLTDKQSSGEQILAALSDRLGGSAAAAADTYAGKQAAMKANVDNFKEAIGSDLLLVLDKLINKFGGPVENALTGFSSWLTGDGAKAISGAIDWVSKYSDIIGSAALVGGLTALTGYVINLDLAFDANPVGAVVLGIEALIALGAALATNFGGIDTAVVGATHSFLSFAISIGRGITDVFSRLANNGIDLINGLLSPMNTIRVALGQAPIKLAHVDFSGIFDNAQNAIDTQAVFAYGAYSQLAGGKSGPAPSKAGTAGGPRAFGDGGTIMPTPGGQIVRVAERGRPETIVDTATLQAAMSSRGNITFNIRESSSPSSTATTVMRYLNHLTA